MPQNAKSSHAIMKSLSVSQKSLIKKEAPSQYFIHFTEETENYIKSFKNKEMPSQLKLTNEEIKQFSADMFDHKSKTHVMDIPVTLRDVVYDLKTLLKKQYYTPGVRLHNNSTFHLSDIKPAPQVYDKIAAKLGEIRRKRAEKADKAVREEGPPGGPRF